MAHQDVTNTVQIELRFFMGNNNAQNTLHALASATPGVEDLNLLGAEIATWLETEWAPLASSDWTATEVVLTSLDSITGPRISIPISPPIPGEVIVPAAPANVTIAIKEDIGIRGRGTAGRIFWVGFAQTQVDTNLVDSSVATAILVALNNLATTISGMIGFEGLCVPHKTVAGVHPNPASSTVVQRFLLTNLSTDSQKDRLPFHKKRKIKVPTPTP